MQIFSKPEKIWSLCDKSRPFRLVLAKEALILSPPSATYIYTDKKKVGLTFVAYAKMPVRTKKNEEKTNKCTRYLKLYFENPAVFTCLDTQGESRIERIEQKSFAKLLQELTPWVGYCSNQNFRNPPQKMIVIPPIRAFAESI